MLLAVAHFVVQRGHGGRVNVVAIATAIAIDNGVHVDQQLVGLLVRVVVVLAVIAVRSTC